MSERRAGRDRAKAVFELWMTSEQEETMSGKERAYEGSCQCGRVRCKVVGPWGAMNRCHCTDCQKMHA